MKPSNNPSSIRSKELLTKALFTLMKTQDYQDISITKLVESSGLTRKTFYRNFNSKEEILEYYMDQIFDEYLVALQQLEEFEPNKIIYIYFKICYKYKTFLILLMKHHLLVILYTKYQNYLSIINNKFQKLSKEVNTRYHIAFSMGGFFQILYVWLENKCKESPEEMVEICLGFLSNPQSF